MYLFLFKEDQVSPEPENKEEQIRNETEKKEVQASKTIPIDDFIIGLYKQKNIKKDYIKKIVKFLHDEIRTRFIEKLKRDGFEPIKSSITNYNNPANVLKYLLIHTLTNGKEFKTIILGNNQDILNFFLKNNKEYEHIKEESKDDYSLLINVPLNEKEIPVLVQGYNTFKYIGKDIFKNENDQNENIQSYDTFIKNSDIDKIIGLVEGVLKNLYSSYQFNGVFEYYELLNKNILKIDGIPDGLNNRLFIAISKKLRKSKNQQENIPYDFYAVSFIPNNKDYIDKISSIFKGLKEEEDGIFDFVENLDKFNDVSFENEVLFFFKVNQSKIKYDNQKLIDLIKEKDKSIVGDFDNDVDDLFNIKQIENFIKQIIKREYGNPEEIYIDYFYKTLNAKFLKKNINKQIFEKKDNIYIVYAKIKNKEKFFVFLQYKKDVTDVDTILKELETIQNKNGLKYNDQKNGALIELDTNVINLNIVDSFFVNSKYGKIRENLYETYIKGNESCELYNEVENNIDVFINGIKQQFKDQYKEDIITLKELLEVDIKKYKYLGNIATIITEIKDRIKEKQKENTLNWTDLTFVRFLIKKGDRYEGEGVEVWFITFYCEEKNMDFVDDIKDFAYWVTGGYNIKTLDFRIKDSKYKALVFVYNDNLFISGKREERIFTTYYGKLPANAQKFLDKMFPVLNYRAINKDHKFFKDSYELLNYVAPDGKMDSIILTYDHIGYYSRLKEKIFDFYFDLWEDVMLEDEEEKGGYRETNKDEIKNEFKRTFFSYDKQFKKVLLANVYPNMKIMGNKIPVGFPSYRRALVFLKKNMDQNKFNALFQELRKNNDIFKFSYFASMVFLKILKNSLKNAKFVIPKRFNDFYEYYSKYNKFIDNNLIP